jgi:hypothetical protein
VGFLRRLLGGRDRGAAGAPAVTGEGDHEAADGEPGDAPFDEAEPSVDEAERARELELARFDQERLSDLVRRQQAYADRSWTPPAQGGERRAEDGDADRG